MEMWIEEMSSFNAELTILRMIIHKIADNYLPKLVF